MPDPFSCPGASTPARALDAVCSLARVIHNATVSDPSSDFDALVAPRADILARYSPYSGVRGITRKTQLDEALRDVLAIERGADPDGRRHDVLGPDGHGVASFYTRRLSWDSEFWGREVYRLVHVLHDLDAAGLLAAARTFAAEAIPSLGCDQIRIEVPAEDVAVVQALTGAGFRLIVTQVAHVKDSLADLDYPRYPVREATEADIGALRRTAAAMRNPYDRTHADVRTPDDAADRYLATFAEACVRGFTDIVLVPDRPEADSIVASNLLASEWERLGVNVAQIVIAAVSAATNRGWAIKMLYETLYLLRERGATRVMMKTQLQNSVVHGNARRTGFRLAASTHVLVYP